MYRYYVNGTLKNEYDNFEDAQQKMKMDFIANACRNQEIEDTNKFISDIKKNSLDFKNNVSPYVFLESTAYLLMDEEIMKLEIINDKQIKDDGFVMVEYNHECDDVEKPEFHKSLIEARFSMFMKFLSDVRKTNYISYKALVKDVVKGNFNEDFYVTKNFCSTNPCVSGFKVFTW